MIKRGAKSAKKQAFPNIGPKYTRSRLLHWCLSLVLVLSILSISAASIFNAGKLQKTIDSTTRAYEMDVAFQVAQDIDERLSHVSLELEMIADSLVRIDASADKLQFLERKKMLTGFTRLAVADLNGHALASDGTVMEIGEMEGFIQAKAGSRGISVLDEQSILYAVPITREETVTGVLVGIRDKESMQALVENNSFRGNGESCVVDRQGNVIISPVHLNLFLALDDVFSDKRDQEFAEEVEKMKQDMQEGENGQLSFHIGTGEKVIMSYHALPSYGWVLLTLIPADLISKESNQFIFQTFLITFFTMAVFSFILLSMFYIYRSNQKNLEQVAFTDPVTGGINNARFQIFCRMLLQQNAEDSYCIVSLNIQNFRLINESFGIEEGNRTLRHILQVLEHALYPGELAARGEADNFYLLLREKKDSMVEARTQRLVKKINSFNLGKERPYFLTISRGGVFYCGSLFGDHGHAGSCEYRTQKQRGDPWGSLCFL